MKHDNHAHEHGQGCGCDHAKAQATAGKCSCGSDHCHCDQAQAASANISSEAAHSNNECGSHCDIASPDTDDPDEQHSHSHQGGCGCSGGDDGHSHDKPVTRKAIILLSASIASFIAAFLIPSEVVSGILFAASALLAGYDLFINGIKMLFKFKFEENVLLLIAVVASFCLGDFPEACLVTILFKLGSLLESSAIGRSKRSMEKLTQIRPDYVYVMDSSGSIVSRDARQISIGDTIYLRAGDRIAVDCTVLEGSSSIDTSALTGEAVPRNAAVGDELLSGSVNLSGLLRCRVDKSFEKSTASQIIELVYQSSGKKAKAESFISRLSKVYTPIVILLALAVAVVPPLLGFGEFKEFISRALIFLVAACPCALVISIPLSFFSAIGSVSKLGVLVKGSMYLERLSKVTAAAFDKTGTLTSGALQVDEVVPMSDISPDELLALAAAIEKGSAHPIADAIVRHASNLPSPILSNIEELAGFGLSANWNGRRLLCGGKALLRNSNIPTNELPPANIYICADSDILGYITIKEDIPDESLSLVEDLKKSGINRVVMLTGDGQRSASIVAEKCGISEYYSELLPINKVEKVDMLKSQGETVLFVGDGINDAPVLTCADLGISMGLGSEIANASSDIVLASNKLSHLSKAIRLSKKGMATVYFNIAFALLIKVLVLSLGAFGMATMWMAVFADIGVTILTVLNSIRLLKAGKA